MSEKITLEVKVRNKYGLHARPASLFVQLCNRFDSEIIVYHNSMQVSGKNILDIMTLGAESGTQLKIEISGADAEAAAQEVSGLFETNFGESE